jgi:hypothetical protein
MFTDPFGGYCLVLVIPWVIKCLLPFVDHSDLKTYLFILVITGIPISVAYWTVASTYSHHKNVKVLMPGKDLKDYITINDPELKEKYHSNSKIPMQVFHDAYFGDKINFNASKLGSNPCTYNTQG